MNLSDVQKYAEEKAAERWTEAAKCVGIDNYADVFCQGQAQAFREMAKYISEQNKTEPHPIHRT